MQRTVDIGLSDVPCTVMHLFNSRLHKASYGTAAAAISVAGTPFVHSPSENDIHRLSSKVLTRSPNLRAGPAGLSACPTSFGCGTAPVGHSPNALGWLERPAIGVVHPWSGTFFRACMVCTV